MIGVLSQASIVALASILMGVVPLAMGIVYLNWPSEQRLALMRPLSLATIFCGIQRLDAWSGERVPRHGYESGADVPTSGLDWLRRSARSHLFRVRMPNDRLDMCGCRAVETSMSLVIVLDALR